MRTYCAFPSQKSIYSYDATLDTVLIQNYYLLHSKSMNTPTKLNYYLLHSKSINPLWGISMYVYQVLVCMYVYQVLVCMYTAVARQLWGRPIC